MNEVRLLGRLTNEPDKRMTASSKEISNIDLAVDSGKDKDGNKKTTFIKITFFGKTAEIVNQYCHKGDQVLCNCEVLNNNYTSKSGDKIYSYNFYGKQIVFLSKAKAETKKDIPVKVDQIKIGDQFQDFGNSIDDNFLD